MKLKIALIMLAATILLFGCNPAIQLEKEDIMSGGEMQIDLVQPDETESGDNPVKNNMPLEIISSDVETRCFRGIFEHDNMLYVVRCGDGMYRMNFDGSDKKLINDDENIFGAIIIDGIAYYETVHEIYFIDSEQKHKTIQNIGYISNAVSVSDYIYYVDASTLTKGIYRIKKDGCELAEQIYPNSLNSMEISDGWIYFTQSQAKGAGSSYIFKESVHKVDLQGENETIIMYFC